LVAIKKERKIIFNDSNSQVLEDKFTKNTSKLTEAQIPNKSMLNRKNVDTLDLEFDDVLELMDKPAGVGGVAYVKGKTQANFLDAEEVGESTDDSRASRIRDMMIEDDEDSLSVISEGTEPCSDNESPFRQRKTLPSTVPVSISLSKRTLVDAAARKHLGSSLDNSDEEVNEMFLSEMLYSRIPLMDDLNRDIDTITKTNEQLLSVPQSPSTKQLVLKKRVTERQTTLVTELFVREDPLKQKTSESSVKKDSVRSKTGNGKTITTQCVEGKVTGTPSSNSVPEHPKKDKVMEKPEKPEKPARYESKPRTTEDVSSKNNIKVSVTPPADSVRPEVKIKTDDLLLKSPPPQSSVPLKKEIQEEFIDYFDMDVDEDLPDFALTQQAAASVTESKSSNSLKDQNILSDEKNRGGHSISSGSSANLTAVQAEIHSAPIVKVPSEKTTMKKSNGNQLEVSGLSKESLAVNVDREAADRLSSYENLYDQAQLDNDKSNDRDSETMEELYTSKKGKPMIRMGSPELNAGVKVKASEKVTAFNKSAELDFENKNYDRKFVKETSADIDISLAGGDQNVDDKARVKNKTKSAKIRSDDSKNVITEFERSVMLESSSKIKEDVISLTSYDGKGESFEDEVLDGNDADNPKDVLEALTLFERSVVRQSSSRVKADVISLASYDQEGAEGKDVVDLGDDEVNGQRGNISAAIKRRSVESSESQETSPSEISSTKRVERELSYIEQRVTFAGEEGLEHTEDKTNKVAPTSPTIKIQVM